mgnify:CR=1 FL=1
MDKFKIVIVDYKMGNTGSIKNAIKFLDYNNVVISSDNKIIDTADCLILPGVGAFPDAMDKLFKLGLIDKLNEFVLIKKKPVLGICLGMQLLFDSSEEKHYTKGFGWISGKVKYMRPQKNLRVPHIGWNSLHINPNNSFFNFLKDDKDFYFDHSLHVECDNEFVLSYFQYGVKMVAAVNDKNVMGMQFHPEKSQKNGLLTIKSFVEWSKNI